MIRWKGDGTPKSVSSNRESCQIINKTQLILSGLRLAQAEN